MLWCCKENLTLVFKPWSFTSQNDAQICKASVVLVEFKQHQVEIRLRDLLTAYMN